MFGMINVDVVYQNVVGAQHYSTLSICALLEKKEEKEETVCLMFVSSVE